MIRTLGACALLAALAASSVPASSASSSSTVTVTVEVAEKAMDWTGKWSRMAIADAGGDLRPAPEPSRVVFEVDPQLFVSMSVGCNQIGSQLLPGEGDAISFAPGMATRMGCEGAVGEAEDRLVNALDQITRHERRGDEIVFLDADGRDLLLIGR